MVKICNDYDMFSNVQEQCHDIVEIYLYYDEKINFHSVHSPKM